MKYDDELNLVRQFSLPGKQKLTFKRDPQFSLWRVSFDKGGIPDKLSGTYTTFEYAYTAAQNYLKSRDKFKCEIGEEI
jgi:hypothetical protein